MKEQAYGFLKRQNFKAVSERQIADALNVDITEARRILQSLEAEGKAKNNGGWWRALYPRKA